MPIAPRARTVAAGVVALVVAVGLVACADDESVPLAEALESLESVVAEADGVVEVDALELVDQGAPFRMDVVVEEGSDRPALAGILEVVRDEARALGIDADLAACDCRIVSEADPGTDLVFFQAIPDDLDPFLAAADWIAEASHDDAPRLVVAESLEVQPHADAAGAVSLIEAFGTDEAEEHVQTLTWTSLTVRTDDCTSLLSLGTTLDEAQVAALSELVLDGLPSVGPVCVNLSMPNDDPWRIVQVSEPGQASTDVALAAELTAILEEAGAEVAA